MKQHGLQKAKRMGAFILVMVLAVAAPLTTYGEGWKYEENSWGYTKTVHQQEEQFKGQWLLEDDSWYYLDSNGRMKTGWYFDEDQHWYYLNQVGQGVEGSMRTGWYQDIDKSWYYLNPVSGGPMGSMQTGWIYDGAGWYHMGKDGQWIQSSSDDSREESAAKPPSTGEEDTGSSSDPEESVLDRDGDGLTDLQEQELGTDPLKSDTDEDGLSDYEEYILRTNPLKADTEEDGLTDKEETDLGTSPHLADSDQDGVWDKEEFALGTDPLRYDTDGDGIGDGKEPGLGFDPLLYDTDGNGIADGKESMQVVAEARDSEDSFPGPSVEATIQSKHAESVTVEREDPQSSQWVPAQMPGLIGAAYRFEVEAGLEQAILTFHFPEELKERKDFSPAIYFVDTEKQELVELKDQQINLEDCTVRAKTDHFSMYVLLDQHEQKLAWETEILTGDQETLNARIDTMLVLDESGSMSSNDRDKMRVTVSRDFVDTLRSGDQAGLVGFGDFSWQYCDLSPNLEIVREQLGKIGSSKGGTNIGAGVSAALTQFKPAEARKAEAKPGTPSNAERTTPSNAQIATSSNADDRMESFPEENEEASMKLIILLTDGVGSYQDSLTQTAIERGVKIYTVGLGQRYNRKLLEKISHQTGGKHYHADHADALLEEFRALTQDTVDIMTDSDEDGLSDYHEERIRLFNGVVLQLNRNEKDSDGDGLTDGEELVQTTDAQGRVFFRMISHPNQMDSDGDGIGDEFDTAPLKFDIAPLVITEAQIHFNTGHVWERLPVTGYEYLHAMWNLLLNAGIHNSITLEEFSAMTKGVTANEETTYQFEELRYIALMDVEGSKLYLDKKTPELRKAVYESLVERESKTYHYQGKFAITPFVETEGNEEGGFLEGKVIQEYDLNLSMRFYYMEPDVHDLFDTVVIWGGLLMTSILVVDLTVITTANLQAIQYYCQDFGVKEGIGMYRTLGTGYVPDGILSVVRSYERNDKGDLASKLDYLFGKGKGNIHNIERSKAMQSELRKIGIHDTSSARQYVTQHLDDALNNPSNVSRVETRTYIAKELPGQPVMEYTATTKESFLMGPGGGVKVESVWDGNRLLTIILKGGY